MTTMDVESRMRLQFEIEQFYYDEAALLDERRFDEWIKLFTDDTHYWMPIRRTRMTSEIDKEFTVPGAMAFFDDGKGPLEARVRKLYTGYAWAEDPPSRTRHFITNVRVLEDDDEQLTVEANFHLYRTRLDSEEDSWMGRRRDVLRRDGSSFKIADRKIYLEQTVLLSKNLSSFF